VRLVAAVWTLAIVAPKGPQKVFLAVFGGRRFVLDKGDTKVDIGEAGHVGRHRSTKSININRDWMFYGPDSTAAAWEVQHGTGEESSSKWGLVSGQSSSFSPTAQSRSWW
jgi:hypothetical protein